MYKKIETLIAACFFYSGLVKLARWWTKRSRQRLVILNYHQASGGDLRRHMLYLRRHYRIVHLETALEELYSSCKSGLRRDQKTTLALTFDDGYYDNYTYAATLAYELQVPITIFLIPDYIENGHRFWWHEADHLVSHGQLSEVTVKERTYHLNKLAERKALAQTIDTHVRYATSVIEREQFLIAMHKILSAPSWITFKEQAALPLTWAQVLEMEETGWVSFGAHTMHHPILAYLADPTEIRNEVSESRAILERQLGHPMRTFAYPVGLLEHIGEHGIPAVREAGYSWAVTTIYGFNTSQTDPYLLRRVSVDIDQHWLEVAAKVSGIWEFFVHPFRMLITLIAR